MLLGDRCLAAAVEHTYFHFPAQKKRVLRRLTSKHCETVTAEWPPPPLLAQRPRLSDAECVMEQMDGTSTMRPARSVVQVFSSRFHNWAGLPFLFLILPTYSTKNFMPLKYSSVRQVPPTGTKMFDKYRRDSSLVTRGS